MKKLFLSLFVFIFTFVSLSAFAAPTRDLTDAAMENEELIAQIQPLADAAAYAAFTQNIPALAPDAAPDAALVETLLYRAFYEHLLVASAGETGITISMDEALKAAARLFSSQNLPELKGNALPALVLRDDQVVMDISQPADFMGTHIYDVQLNEEKLLLKTDVYRLNGIVASAFEAPEDSLVWLGAMVLELKPEADSAVGFTLSGFEVKERYQPSSLLQFTKTDRCELQYPDIFTKVIEDQAAFLHLQTEDGAASLKLMEVPGTLENLMAVWQNEAVENAQILDEDGRAVLTAPGLVRFAYSDPQDGQDVCLVMEMIYPLEREMEFTLYRTFLNNSFVVYSHSMG